jgi:hypothetical protein
VTIRLNPDRDVQRFRALTFLARGEKGGEKLRVRLRDAHDVAMERVLAAGRWPASLFPRTAAADGTLKLGAGWRMVRVPFDSYPEIDRSALAEIAFECGEDVGNGKDATIYLDEIGLGD